MQLTDKPELMAPAGTWESLMAAIHAGADSVYFGVEQLNMRARATNNFTADDLPEIARRCHEHGVKAYLTLNTILYDHDITLMKLIIDRVKSAGIDAVIVADHAALNYAKKTGVAVHISTQANISNIDTIEFFAEYADVMVLARELSLMQVKSITREIARRNITGPSGKPVRIEVFAHGALCMAISGKCYLSLHSHFASANRGACIQNCRRAYTVKDEEGIEFEVDNEYIMSAKDLCTITFLDKMIDAGIYVMKIEGRARAADYVHETVSCYREAIDSIGDNTYHPDKFGGWIKRLETVYNRGFWDGYYLGRKMGEWSDVYGSKATTKKVHVGKGVKYFPKNRVGEFLMESQQLSIGDDVIITGPTTGLVKMVVSELRLEGQSVSSVKKGDTFSMPVEEKIRPSDTLYKIVQA